MGRSSKRPTTSNLFKEYNGNITSRTAKASRSADRDKASRSADRDERNKDPYCCCCKSTSVLIFTNTVTFVLSLGLIVVGAFINNEVSVRALPSTHPDGKSGEHTLAHTRRRGLILHRARPTGSLSSRRRAGS